MGFVFCGVMDGEPLSSGYGVGLVEVVAFEPPGEFFGVGGFGVVEAFVPSALVVGTFGFLDLGERGFGGRIAGGALVLGFGDPGVEAGGEVCGGLGGGDGLDRLGVGAWVEQYCRVPDRI